MSPLLTPIQSAAKKIILSAKAEKVVGPAMIKLAKVAVRYIQKKDLVKHTDADEKFCDFVIEILQQIEQTSF